MLRNTMIALLVAVVGVPPAWAATGRITCSSNWNSSRRSWLGRDGPGIMLGDVDSGKRYFFTRT